MIDVKHKKKNGMIRKKIKKIKNEWCYFKFNYILSF